RVRTGYATAVLLGGPTASSRVLARVRVSLVDLDDEDARQPYHVVSEQDEKRGMRLVRQTRDTATAEATRAIRQLMEQADQAGHRVRAVTLVAGSDVGGPGEGGGPRGMGGPGRPVMRDRIVFDCRQVSTAHLCGIGPSLRRRGGRWVPSRGAQAPRAVFSRSAFGR